MRTIVNQYACTMFEIGAQRQKPSPSPKGPSMICLMNFESCDFVLQKEERCGVTQLKCMSQAFEAHNIELHMFTARERDDVAELLVATAHYHRTGRLLDVGHTVNFGRPWLDGSQCSYGLLSLPYLDGPSLERLRVGERETKFLWLIPITSAEKEFARVHGPDALEARFEQEKLDYLDPKRKSVV
jgi:Suppressor of fused protein (SUFU)